MPRRVDAEIPSNNRVVIQNAAHGKAFRHKPVREILRDLGFVGTVFHPDQRGGDPHAGGRVKPAVRKDVHIRRVERPVGQTVQKHRVGHKFRVLFPLQRVLPDLAREMRGTRLRMCRAVAIQQRLEVIKVQSLVPRSRRLGLFQCEVDSATGRWVAHRVRRHGTAV